MSGTDTVVLFRPVGQREHELIRESGFRAFPPWLPEQPYIYPVLNEAMPLRLPATGTQRTPPQATLGMC